MCYLGVGATCQI